MVNGVRQKVVTLVPTALIQDLIHIVVGVKRKEPVYAVFATIKKTI